MRVLSVEDDQLVTNTAANALAQESYVVDVATNGQLGWQFVQTVVASSTSASEYPKDGADWQTLYQAARAALCRM